MNVFVFREKSVQECACICSEMCLCLLMNVLESVHECVCVQGEVCPRMCLEQHMNVHGCACICT